MKKLIMLAIVMLALGTAGSAFAVLDWAGAVWPTDGYTVVPTEPIDVYAQVFKGGVTDLPGQGADISAVLKYTTDIAGEVVVPMPYFGDNGVNNDEYSTQVPQAALAGAAWVDVTVVFTDATDGSDYMATDQNNSEPPFRYNITNVLPNDVDVTFTLCLSGAETTDGACVIGSAAEITAWGSGVPMTNIGGELYEVTVTFLAGGNPNFEYKFKKDAGCSTWEGVPNRLMALPTDGSTSVSLSADSWDNAPILCGMGSNLTEDKVVCFQVCLSGVENTGGVCVAGNLPELDTWGAGVPMVQIATDLYQACIVFPAGTAVPLNLEYKFKKDDCATWEGFGNRLFLLDDAAAAETTLTHVWEDGPGVCDPVGVERSTWGGLKTLYR
ncbi:MAG: carbohydrate-binding module family 20 domain-containing protein [Candidatus Krumholzibacteria bacterium]|nr:carbohydrate-binding module family 20 domain-containing protein [Candidatus Krumholzibacteria bacterium]